VSSPLRLGVRISRRPVTATERTGSAGIPMISTVPFRRTGGVARRSDHASPGSPHMRGPHCPSSSTEGFGWRREVARRGRTGVQAQPKHRHPAMRLRITPPGAQQYGTPDPGDAGSRVDVHPGTLKGRIGDSHHANGSVRVSHPGQDPPRPAGGVRKPPVRHSGAGAHCVARSDPRSGGIARCRDPRPQSWARTPGNPPPTRNRCAPRECGATPWIATSSNSSGAHGSWHSMLAGPGNRGAPR